NSTANERSMTVCGNARFTVLTTRLIRLEWSANEQFEDRGTFAFPNRYGDAPNFSCEQNDAEIRIKTEALDLHYRADGESFNAKNLSIRLELDGEQVEWTPGMLGTGNLRGTRRTLDQNAEWASLEEGILSRDGWVLFDDSKSVVWDTDRLWVEARPEEPLQDWYFFGYGHDYKATLADYIRFGGAIPLIPRYVLGGWWSRYWRYSADDLKQLVRDFESHEIPLDVLVVDMDWHTPVTWTGYTWDRELFPDPEAFLDWVHEQGLYATLNLHPAQGVQKHEEIYPQFATRLGQDPATGEAVRFRASNKSFIEAYFELLHHPMEAQGVDFWWIDWQQEKDSEIKGLDPLPWLNHLHFRDSARRGTRPMLYSRWGGLGNHRYPIGFSGDAYSTWESLRFQVYFTQTAANVAYGWWSHDIGGHFWATQPELYARWVQFGALSPALRLHSTKDPLAERRPWGFPSEVYEAAKAAFQFRYQLLPYLYSAARNLSQKGLSLCAPMYYEYPDCEDAYLARDQYFLGDQMIVAPITSPADPATGLAAVNVWIPEGRWIDYGTLEVYDGPKWIRIEADLKRMPMFVRAGAILPMASGIMQTRDNDGSHLTLMVFPGADGEFELYEDDGLTQAYREGAFEITQICAKRQEGKIVVRLEAAAGFCDTLPAMRTVELHLKGVDAPSRVTVDGAENGWHYDAAAGEAVVTIGGAYRRAALQIEVTADENVKCAKPAENPLIQVIDYTLFEEARQHLGTVIVAPSDDAQTFDAEIEWRLINAAGTTVRITSLKGSGQRLIACCPFADTGDAGGFRWSASVTVSWDGKQITRHYKSRDAYPSVYRWQTLIYEAEMRSIREAAIGEKANKSLPWVTIMQTRSESLPQPFPVIFLENEPERITSGEALEACLRTTLVSPAEQEAILYVQHVGEGEVPQTLLLNGVELKRVEAVQHATFSPTFYSWMPTKDAYYGLPLRTGDNSLVILTRPDRESGRWGVAAMVMSTTGEVLKINGNVS
ncbi:MAG: TIM-barrel domain-containing protein, partial [Chloroflexota bacterium]